MLLYMKLFFLLESCLFLGKSLVILYLYFFVIMFKFYICIMESEYFKWYVFSKREKMSMKKKFGDINEKKFFYGILYKYIDVICR